MPARLGRAEISPVDAAFRAAGVVLLCVAMWIPWAASRVGGSQSAPRLVDLPMARLVFVACVLVIIAATGLQLSGRETAGGQAATIAATAIVTIVPLLGMALIEFIAIWLSPDLVPRTFRRLAVGAKPMPGIWITVVAGLLCLIGATGRGDTVAAWFASLWDGLRQRSDVAYSAALLLIALPALGFARYGSWLEVRSSFDDWSVPGWAFPWFGLLTLAVLVVASGAGCVSAVRPSVGAGILLSILGWTVTVLAGLTITVTSALPTVEAPGWMTAQLVDLSEKAQELTAGSPVDIDTSMVPSDLRIDVASGRGAMVAFVAGVAIMLAGWLTCRVTSVRDTE